MTHPAAQREARTTGRIRLANADTSHVASSTGVPDRRREFSAIYGEATETDFLFMGGNFLLATLSPCCRAA
jgi:hypothetical protein